MGLWNDFGFRDNPYSTQAIPPTAEGVELLVGRDAEARRLHRLITSSDTHPTVEGDNGVGKTSLVQVTAYTAMRSAETHVTDQVHLPLAEVFQITADQTPTEFVRRVCFEVVQGFKDHHQVLRDLNLSVPDRRAIDRWINQPVFRNWNMATPVGGGGSGSTPNTGGGFNEDGFVRTVFGWLKDCFPTRQLGGFVCVLDNLELLETSTKARQFLEALRDTLFTTPGLEWVLCGARGVVRGVVSSPRLHGVLGTPLELKAVKPALVGDVIERRIELYALDDDFFLPVDPDGFAYIYGRVNCNLRDSLKLCESFGLEYDDRPSKEPSREELFALLKAWLESEGSKYHEAAQTVPAQAWAVFEALVARGGSCTTSDSAAFGFSSNASFCTHLHKLASANLVVLQTDQVRPQRKVVSVTTNGWLVHGSSSFPNKPQG